MDRSDMVTSFYNAFVYSCSVLGFSVYHLSYLGSKLPYRALMWFYVRDEAQYLLAFPS